ncbi:hypothetical protein FTO70_16770 [Methanosarcina sp. KYL-1]|uniref:hypothetical protein n=1 Tax=Methanosarcina sp. KYL-1 TaxID=2602068 RepID=UPI002101C8A2|nr:hypothetical protein [Methanosarcina sp. KYL-1]MCQ1537294.1 hypothetical protein [Methanosarcina sp. KYL-1]
MRKLAVLFMALSLCILAIPAMAEDEPGDPNSLLPGDNIWISISPMEAHPMYIDRPAPVIPTIPGYPIRVAVYSNPYRYLTTDEDDNPIWAEIYDPNTQNFSVTDLKAFTKDQITLRLPNETDSGSPALTGASYTKVHMENDYKYEYVFYVRDLSNLDSSVERLFFVADNGVDKYQGSGLVKVTETSQSGGGKKGSSPKGGAGGSDNNRNNGGGPDDSKPQGPNQGGKK